MQSFHISYDSIYAAINNGWSIEESESVDQNANNEISINSSNDAYQFAAVKNGWYVEDIFVDDVSYYGADVEIYVNQLKPVGRNEIDTEMSVNQLEPVDSNEIDTEMSVNQLEPVGSNEVDTEMSVNQLEPVGSNEIPSDNSFLVEATNEPLFVGRPKRGRKRKISTQSRQDRKRLYNQNKTHINTRGNIVYEKICDENFVCSCRKRCIENVPLQLRKRLFNQFWTMGSYAGRAVLLVTCVAIGNKNRYKIYGYEVCKRALAGILQIDEGRISLAMIKHNECDTYVDRRGLSTGGRNALPVSKKEEIRAHISSFPKYVSHYTRNQTDSKFLNANMNLERMYNLYRAEHANPPSKSVYKEIFYKDFNLRFKPPKKDTCKICDLYAVQAKSADEPTRRIIENNHNNHLDVADSLQKQMKSDLKFAKINPELETLTYDMQKTLCLPRMPTNIVYYKRQLNFYNLGIHVGSSGKGIFNVWKENEGSKGTQEIGSCLRKYINENIHHPTKHLILWSDSCGGQNRSIKLVLMLICVLQHHPSLETISLRYLQSGHSFLPNDTEFGDFECSLKSHERVYTDAQYVEIMEQCRTVNTFEVNRILPQYFYSIKNAENLITNRKTDTLKNKINWLDTHEIILDKPQPYIIKMKKKIGDDFQSVDLSKARTGTEIHLNNVELDPLWPVGRPLSAEKAKDLKEMLKLVPEEYKHFYAFLDDVATRLYVEDVDGYGEVLDFDLED